MEATYKVHQLKMGFFNFLNYSYIITDQYSKNAVIIDPAWELEKIEEFLKQQKVELRGILLTHSHYDHTNLVNSLTNKYGVKVFMAQAEIDFYKFHCNNLIGLHDEDIITLGKTKISCLHTPGHTVGSMCYLLPEDLFTGDCIFIEGCGICVGEGASPDEMYDSIQKIKERVPYSTFVYPGHTYGKRTGYPLEYLMNNNIYFQINNRKYFVEFRMRKGQKDLFNFK